MALRASNGCFRLKAEHQNILTLDPQSLGLDISERGASQAQVHLAPDGLSRRRT